MTHADSGGTWEHGLRRIIPGREVIVFTSDIVITISADVLHSNVSWSLVHFRNPDSVTQGNFGHASDDLVFVIVMPERTRANTQ